MADHTEKVAGIEDQMRALRERIRGLKAQPSAQERRDTARRRIIDGAACLSALGLLDAERRARTFALVAQHITSPRDREFLGLAPIDEQRGAAAASGHGSEPAPSTRPGAASPDRPAKREDKSADEGAGTSFLPMFARTWPSSRS